jgi:hypothetical protein
MMSARVDARSDPEAGALGAGQGAQRGGEFLGVADDDVAPEGQGAAGEIKECFHRMGQKG